MMFEPFYIPTGVVCEPRMNGFRIFVTQSADVTDEAPVYTSTEDSPGPLIDIDLGWEVGR